MTSRPAAGSTPHPQKGLVGGYDSRPPEQVLVQLQQKLDSLPTIEQAKGILMARFDLDAETAFTLLVRWSQATNVKLRVICTSLVESPGRPGALDALIDALQQSAPGTGAPVRVGSSAGEASG